MPTVPYSPVPDVSPSTAGTPGFDIRASPEAFGAQIGQATQGLGQTVEQAGTRLADVAGNIQTMHNNVASDGAFNQFQDGTQKILYGDPNDTSNPGYYSLRGQAAVDARPGVLQQLDDLRNSIRNGLQNPVQQLSFDEASRRLNQYSTAGIGAHSDREYNRYAVETQTAAIDIKARAVANGYNDDELFQHNLEDALRAADAKSALSGANPDTDGGRALFANNRMQAAQTLYTARAVAMGTANPAAGLAFVQAHSDQFDAITLHRLTDEFKGGADRQAVAAGIAGELARPVTGSGGTPATATTNQIDQAIHGQESRGAANSPTSIDGAVGGYQILPATFQQYAKPGERIDNPTDNAAVGKRIVADLAQKYGGDPARVAVAYFSGPGNVAPAGSATPWLEDRKDGNGTSTSAYVAGVLRRLPSSGQGAPAGKPFAIGDSIAAGTQAANGLDGGGVVGAGPGAVLANIKALPPGQLSGRPVVLSSGVSNNPADIGLVEQQIAALKTAGASDIRLLGVGDAKFPGVNAQLAAIAQKDGVTFTGPLQTGADGVHPVNYTGLGGVTAGAASTVSAGGSAVAPAAHDPAPYGVEFARMQQARERAAALFPDRPDLQRQMTEGVWQEIQQANVLQAKYEAEQAKQARDAQQAAGQRFMQQILTDPSKLDPAALAKDPSLTWEQKNDLFNIAQKHLGEVQGGKEAKEYGSGFWSAYQAVHSSDPASQITDPAQLWGRGGPNGDLSLAGIQALTAEINGTHTPEGAAEGQAKKAWFDAAHIAISGHGMFGGQRDAVGEMNFAHFLTAALPELAKEKSAGMTLAQSLAKDGPLDKLMSQFKRTPAQMMNDMMQANNPDLPGAAAPAAGSGAAPTAGKVDLSTIAGINAALGSGYFGYGPAARAKAMNEARSRGLANARPKPSGEPSAPTDE